MSTNTIPAELYIDAARVFHWATKRHFQLWFTGEEKTRHTRTEIVLKRLTRRGKIRAVRFGKKLVYALPRKSKRFSEIGGLSKVAHGLECTECLVRFFRSGSDGEVIAERYFYGLGAVPEWGIRYSNGTLLLCEFCTKSNFYFSGNIKGKVAAYRNSLEKIEEKFQTKAVVVFVCDVARSAVKREVGSLAGARAGGDGFPFDPFFFTDYETFKNVTFGEQLTAPIYFWMDGKEYPLK